MKFDETKIYTSVNADEVEVGSKGYFADDIYELKCIVENDDTGKLKELTYIEDTTYSNRFSSDISYNLFYLVEEPAEKKCRPYKNTEEMIEDFKRRYNSYGGWSGKSNPMYCPLIWVVGKHTKSKRLITFYSDCRVSIDSGLTELKSLFEHFTYLDGTPCGILK